MSEELKPCPFCEGEGVIYEYSTVETCPCSIRPAQPTEAEGVDRNRMIESMCLTWRHDFGLDKPEGCALSSGMTVAEREHLRGQMAKLFDHHFGPALSAVTAEVEGLRKDAERYRMFRRGMFDPDRFDADIDAAMAAKEE